MPSTLLIVSIDDDDSGLNLQNMCRLKHLVIRDQLNEVPKFLLRFLPQLQLPARRTLETITLCPNFSLGRSYDARAWTPVDEALADAATFPCLRSIVISPISWVMEHEPGIENTDLGVPRLLALHDRFELALHNYWHLRRCSEGGLSVTTGPIKITLQISRAGSRTEASICR